MSVADIAIVGMACRFPMAGSVDEFWRNLCEGKECLTKFNNKALLLAGIPLTDIQNPNYVPVRGILEDIDLFDADFFRINPADASIMDPQQRVFLECAWQALEHSGNIPSKKPDATISVFTGMAESCYLQQNLLKNREFCQRYTWTQSRIATGYGTLSTQLSYRLNLRGSSINLNTACSTGLVAVIYACQELLLGRSNLALAGAVAIELPQTKGYLYKASGIDSRDGHCRPFSHNANGTVFSNGAGVVVLKRLADAIADRDTVYAVIKGYGINNDGSNKLNYYAPSIDGQAACIHAALTQAKVSAADIGLIEAHGTATELGDFIEITALNKVFRQFTQQAQYCALGSVKSNIGHADLSAGIASLIKAALCTYYQKIPATLHFEQPNPKICYQDSPFYINSELIPWTSSKDKPYVGVSAFGIGGTNAHVLLTGHSLPAPTDLPSSVHLDQVILLSAKSATALQQSAVHLQDYLQDKNSHSAAINLADVAYTLQTGRDEFNWRGFRVGKDIRDITNGLAAIKPMAAPAEKASIIFMFPGQGSQYANMAYTLYQQIPLFKQTIDRCSQITQTYLSLGVEKLLFSDLSESLLTKTAYAQPALFIIEYALAQLLIHYGVEPSLLVGHSIGEYAAACLAEVFSLEDALFLVSERGRLMGATPAGRMLAISCHIEEFEHYQQIFSVELAAHNSDGQCVAAGEIDEITRLMAYLKQQGKPCHLLNVNHAFHSCLTESISDPFYAAVSKVTLQPPRIPVISNLTGHLLTAEEAIDPKYWCRHLRHAVQFKKSVDTLISYGSSLAIETGPGQVLSYLLPPSIPKIHALPNIRQKGSDFHQFLTALGFAWQYGVKIDWSDFYKREPSKHVALPTYPFERKCYWVEPDQDSDFSVTPPRPAAAPRFFRPTWIRELPYAAEAPCITDTHQTWIIFKDTNSLLNTLIANLQANQITPVIIEMGKNYQEINENRYQIDPAEKSHYLNLFTALKDKITDTPMIIHSFSANQGCNGFLTDAQIDRQLQLGFYSIMYLAQAYLDIMGGQASLHCTVITQTSQQVMADDIVVPVNATLSGACRGIPQEHPLLRFQLVDINLYELENNSLKLSNTILQLCIQNHWDSNNIIVALRRGFHWKLDYVGVELNSNKNRFKDRGVYLVTGGLGGIGLTLCEQIAKTVAQPVLILLSRSKMPPVLEWEQTLRNPDQTQYHEKIKRLQQLQSLGATVILHSVDIAQLQSLKHVVQETLQSYGQINGVIHAAGIFNVGSAQTDQTMQTTFLPKVQGTYHLAEALKDTSLDFVVFCSSLSALIGLPGHIDYCSANACLDAFLASKLFSASLILSVNWNTWQEVGMLASAPRLKKLSFLNIGNDITPQQGQQLFMQIMQDDYPQVAISNYKIAEFTKIAAQKNRTNNTNLPTHREYVDNPGAVQSQLLSLWQDILGVKQISVEDDFFDLGAHSLSVLELINFVYQKFHCSLTPVDIYTTRTINTLSALITISQDKGKEMDVTALQLYRGKAGLPCMFLFPPVSGTIFCYNDMISIWDLDFPVYGLHDQSIAIRNLPFNDLRVMAKSYCAKLRQIQPHGPYFLVGYSYGAMLAYEIAYLLTQQGEKIQLLAMIDGWAIFPPEQQNEQSFKKILKQRHSTLPPLLVNLAWQRMQLLLAHHPKKTGLDIILFKAKHLSSEYLLADDPYNGWRQPTTGRITCHPISADHETIMHKSNIISIVKHLKEAILESVN